MVDVPAVLATNLAAMANNTTGAITEQVLRNAFVSVLNIVPVAISAAGTTAATATVATTHVHVVTTCASGAGVMANASYTQFLNRAANACLVYPITGAAWEGLSANAPVSIPVGGSAEFFMTSPTQGYVR
jgi:hypothetical protein